MSSAKKAEKNDLNELLERLDASPEGLSSNEAEKRLQNYGPNELPEEKTNALLKLLSYFLGSIHWMIEAAVALIRAINTSPILGLSVKAKDQKRLNTHEN